MLSDRQSENESEIKKALSWLESIQQKISAGDQKINSIELMIRVFFVGVILSAQNRAQEKALSNFRDTRMVFYRRTVDRSKVVSFSDIVRKAT